MKRKTLYRQLVRMLCLSSLVSLTPAAALGQAAGSVLMLIDADGRRLAVGDEVRSTLSTSDFLSARDNFLEAWELEGRAGESVTVDMISDDFDAYLYVVGPGLGETLSDDDGGGGCHARISFTLLEDGPFRVVASSNGSRETGRFTLRASEVPSPTPNYSCGGVNPAVLADLPTEGRTLQVDRTDDGILGAADAIILDDRRGQAWSLEGSAGTSVTVTLLSDDFDAYLYVIGPGLDEALSDDDSAGDLNAQITVAFPRDGVYTVVASSLGAGSGTYSLRVDEPVDLNELDTGGRNIRPGQILAGLLSEDDPVVIEGRRGQAWALDGHAGQRVTIELRSDDFDCYLYLIGPGLELLSDDDGAGDLDSRISVTLPEDGRFRIIVSALGANGLGEFTLEVDDSSGPRG